MLALVIQLIAFAAALAAAHLLSSFFRFELSIAAAALLQGATAALLARLAAMPRWWLYLHFLFAPALLFAQALALPPWIHLAAFVALASLYWNIHRTRVPFYPSGPAVWRAVAALLPADRPVRFIDIGSGLGGLPMALARQRPDGAFAGIELAPLPWLASVLCGRLRGSRATFLRGDYGRLDLAGYDVVFAYLSPAAMPSLWRKARGEMRPGALLLSYEFAIPDVEPDLVESPVPGGAPLYGWRM